VNQNKRNQPRISFPVVLFASVLSKSNRLILRLSIKSDFRIVGFCGERKVQKPRENQWRWQEPSG